jgi:aldose 1-epimerase
VATVSSWVTPTSTHRPGPISPTTSPATRTRAWLTRWTTARTPATLRNVVEIGAGRAVVRIDPDAGGRLASLEVDGSELLVTRDGATDKLRWGCFPMAPWAGRVRRGRFRFEGTTYTLPVNLPPHAIHGTTFDRPWTVDAASETHAELTIDLGPAWPFGGSARQLITLRESGLDLRLEVHATDEAMPASAGWHPWWRRRLDRGDQVQVELAARWMYVRDADGIPTGELALPAPPPWDDCFTGLSAPPRLRWPGVLALTIESSCEHVVVFDEPEHAVCVEPQTGPPDALNLGPAIVVPGQPLVATATLAWSGP